MISTTRYISIRVPSWLSDRLSKATDRSANPYAPTQTQVILRGIELALAEMEGKRRG